MGLAPSAKASFKRAGRAVLKMARSRSSRFRYVDKSSKSVVWCPSLFCTWTLLKRRFHSFSTATWVRCWKSDRAASSACKAKIYLSFKRSSSPESNWLDAISASRLKTPLARCCWRCSRRAWAASLKEMYFSCARTFSSKALSMRSVLSGLMDSGGNCCQNVFSK